MNKQMTKMKFLVLAIITLFCLTAEFKAQTTTFTYQGRFNDTTVASPTNGTYEMLFKLFTTAQTGTGTQLDAQLIPTVQVVNGIFTVQLDAENSFNNGADVFIEMSVRPAGSQAAATTLSPRQQVTSAPYSVKSKNAQTAVNADNLGGVPASDYTQNSDTRLSDDRNPTAGSTNYIQNTNSLQSSSNFNVSGNGTAGGTLSANVVNSQTNFRIGSTSVFSTPNSTSVVVGQQTNQISTGASNSFFGYNAGAGNTTGFSNTFIGSQAGMDNMDGKFNVFVGGQTGEHNTSGANNVFSGFGSGLQNTTGSRNAFFGNNAGVGNEDGSENAFFGNEAGSRNKASENSFFGYQAGFFSSTGGENSFFGYKAGFNNKTANFNTYMGYQAGMDATGQQNTIIGSFADTTTGFANSLFGYNARSSGGANVVFGAGGNAAGDNNVLLGTSADAKGNGNTIVGYNAGTNAVSVTNSTAIGTGAVVSTNNTIVLGTSSETTQIPGKLSILTLGASGLTKLCLNTSNQVSTCTNGNFAENKSSETGAAMMKEISDQKARIEAQQATIDALKKLVCATNTTADVCKEVK